jgi:REP element-mobilizing transposase RayT
MVARDRRPVFLDSALLATVEVFRKWHEERDGTILAVTVMPDHVHVLFGLGMRLTVGQCVGRWKSEVRRVSDHRAKAQRDFFEHRLRASELADDYGLYIFLNPYRAGLISVEEVWPGWWAPEPRLFWFWQHVNGDGTPPKEWLWLHDEQFEGIVVGE